MRCYSRNSTHTYNQWKFNTQCQSIMHVDKPKDQHLASHATNKLHLISSLNFSKQLEHPRSSLPLYFHGSKQIRISHLTLLSFFLRKELEALLSSFSHTHESNTERKKNSQLSSPSHTYGSSSNKEVPFNSSQALVPDLKQT